MYAVKIFEAFQNEPEKAKVLFEFAEKVEKSLEFSENIVTKLDLELSKKELEYKIKQLESNTMIQLKEIEGKIETTKKELEIKIEKSRSSLLKWSFLFWITQMISLFGLFYTIVKILQK